METKTGKRIVSKSEYVKAQGKRATLGLSGGLCFAFAFIFGLVAVISLLSAITSNNGAGQAAVFACSCLAYFCFLGGKNSLDRAYNIDTGVPLTRANTADLPAPDTLVRASEQPLQAQEAVLLRAAAQGVETTPEQLVRASVRQEQG